jgi:hypothetical protein
MELALGETLLKLFDGDRLLRLGYARQADYVRERLGVALRSAHSWTALARGLASRPVLRRAVQAGRVSARKALVVMEAASGEREATWTAAAVCMNVRELERCVKSNGFDSAADCFEVESIVLAMTAAQQDRLDAALELAKEVVGPATPRWMRLEALCQEWLGEFGGSDYGAAVHQPLEVKPGLVRNLGALPALEEELPDSAEQLDARARALLRRRLEREEELGRLLLPVFEQRLYEGRFDDYVRDRLGMSPRGARQRIWLERRLRKLPALRSALAGGRVTLTKALTIAKRACPYTVDSLIAEAESTSWQQFERASTEEEDRQNRADGKRRLWGPVEAFETILHAIRVAQEGGLVQGEALARIADHFVAVWTLHRERKRPSKARRKVLARHGGRCAVPGCSAPAAQEHHLVYRSRGGSDDLENRVALCSAHHLRGVHGGHLSVEGRAGDELTWRFGDEAWVTYGDDDVRREVAAMPC